MDLATAILDATLRAATPLALAALGELLIERSGTINIGLEGGVLAGAFGAAAVAQSLGAHAGLLGGALAGAAIGALFAIFAVTLRSDQIIAGTAVTLLALGLTGSLARTLFGEQGVALTLPTLPATRVLGLERLPLVGEAILAQPYVFYLTVMGAVALHLWMTRTHAGLALRAVGESRGAAISAGIPADRFRWYAILVGSSMSGASGAVLVLAQSGTFVEGMSAGRGFIAIAIVALGRWRALPVLAGAVLFGAASALQFAAQALGWALPYQLFLAAPYLATLAVLATSTRRGTPPAALGQRQARDDLAPDS
ncbi:MAG: ABC transporter permease [Gemmatimonadaceae bacterium]